MSTSVVLELLARILVIALAERGRHQKAKGAPCQECCADHQRDPVHLPTS